MAKRYSWWDGFFKAKSAGVMNTTINRGKKEKKEKHHVRQVNLKGPPEA